MRRSLFWPEVQICCRGSCTLVRIIPYRHTRLNPVPDEWAHGVGNGEKTPLSPNRPDTSLTLTPTNSDEHYRTRNAKNRVFTPHFVFDERARTARPGLKIMVSRVRVPVSPLDKCLRMGRKHEAPGDESGGFGSNAAAIGVSVGPRPSPRPCPRPCRGVRGCRYRG